MMPRIAHKTAFAAFIFLMGCIEPYEPPYSDKDVGFFVVDGFLDSGNKTATVKLSFAVPLDASTTANPARKATVSVEREDGSVISLTETSDGVYKTSSDLIETGKKFKLRVSINSKEYVSDPVPLKASPVLDTITWRADHRGVTIYLDSHDVAGATKYYQWLYTETWEYVANRLTTMRWTGDKVVGLKPEQMVYTCYGTNISTKVLITSTSTNTQDVVNDFPLAFVPAGSTKLRRLYSIEVEQRAIDEQAYTYWLNLQRTTEGLGGLFDPMPNEVTGNIRNAKNSSERVLGYFSGGEIQKKRLFIKSDDLPNEVLSWPAYCPDYNIDTPTLRADYTNKEVYLITVVVEDHYTTASPICIDCRLLGGVTKRPDFWPAR
ncbi:MAG TPA: DUF4249 domain-containing protein [Cyclobacteriaceae bacterium]|nr:DUF4249 domain-containing protein [Cyclobacteriaceae bacterium]